MSDPWDPPSIGPPAPPKPPAPPEPPAPEPPPAPPDVIAASEVAESDLSGRELGDYRLLRRLGRGAMAVVYLAEQRSLGRQVALKILRGDLAEDETYVKRFHNEARAAAALVHANIVQTHEVGCIDGVHYIAQEYVAGQNLSQLIARTGPLEEPLAVHIMLQVASALAKSGQQGIVHRDIKPDNIMLAQSGEVKVADFGLARIETGDGQPGTGKSGALNLTQVGMTMGTPLYMSPEQVQGKKLDSRSDLYSLGVTCYHMLAGHPPFEGDTALNVAVQHINEEPVNLDGVRGDLHPELCDIVAHLLAKEPEDRYASPRELLRDLRPLRPDDEQLDDLTESAAAEQYWTSNEEHTQALEQLGTMMLKASGAERPTKFWRWAILAIVVALITGGFVAWRNRAPTLLADAGPMSSGIQAQDSAKNQYAWARSLASISAPDEQRNAWLSVQEHFPDDAVYVPLAKLQLAWLAVRQEQNDAALELFAELTELSDTESQMQTMGLAGEFIATTLDGNDAAKEKLAEFSARIGGLTPQHLRKFAPTVQQTLGDSEMLRLVALLIRKQQRSTTAEASKQWDQFLESLVREDDAGPAAG